MATAPLLSQPPAVTSDAAILAALGRWQTGHRAHDITAADAAEAELLATRATTPEGVAALLWVALSHLEPDAGDAPERGDLQWLEANSDRFDWGGRFIVAALRSLAAMPDRPANAVHGDRVARSELENRDRIALLICYLKTLLASASEDIDTALAYLPRDSNGRLTMADAATSLAMASEYLAELERLEERPLAREQRETETV